MLDDNVWGLHLGEVSFACEGKQLWLLYINGDVAMTVSIVRGEYDVQYQCMRLRLVKDHQLFILGAARWSSTPWDLSRIKKVSRSAIYAICR